MSDWKDWYDKRRDDFNESRRQQYAEDKDKRAKAREQAREYRARRKSGHVVERELTRTLNGETVRVFSSGEIADDLECSRQMLVNWEKRGWLPPPIFPDTHRLYTEHQVGLIHYLWGRVKAAKRAGNRKLDERLQPAIKEVAENWSG